MLALLNRNVAKRPKNFGAYFKRGQWYSSHGRFDEALKDVTRYSEMRRSDAVCWLERACLLERAGEAEEYDRQRREMLRLFSGSPHPLTPGLVGLAFGLGPCDSTDPDLRAVDAMLEKNAPILRLSPLDTNDSWRRLAHGMIGYRCGDLARAEDLLSGTLNDPEVSGAGRATAYMFLAMIRHRRGEMDRARDAIMKGTEILEKEIAPIGEHGYRFGWSDWVIAHIAHREAEALLKSPVQPKKAG